MKTKGFWVIKYDSGVYYCGLNTFDKQIRKAKVYVWKEKAEEQAEYLKSRGHSPLSDCKVIAVSPMKELRDTEAEWWYSEVDPIYRCSVCGYSALNDYRGRSTPSKFCPHCGKYMINHQQEDD